MPITALPTAPSRARPATFSAEADALLSALPTFVTELNAAAIGESAADLALALNSEAAGDGTALLGSEDAGGYFVETRAEGQLQSLGLSRKESGRLEDFGIGADVGITINAMLAAGITSITCDTDCTCTTPIYVERDDVSIQMRCSVTWSGSVSAGVTTDDITGVITVRGALTGTVYTKTLAATLNEGNNTITLDDSTMFAVGEYWRVKPSASEWGPLSFMLPISAVDTGAHTVSFNYKAGWTVASGSSYTFQKVNAVRGARIYIQELIYATAEGATSGVAGIGEQYTVDCDAVIAKASNIKYPGILRRWCVGGRPSMRELVAPQDITTGGMGYGIQQIHVLYGRANNTRVVNSRHANDWSGCAYCVDDGIYASDGLANTTDFSCHLAYDHDNTLKNFSGWLSWDNLSTFGQSGKRLKAINGVAKGQLAWFSTTPDCTFEDVRVIGDIIGNPDGATLRNVTQSGGTTRWIQSSTSSAKGVTELIGCTMIPRLAGAGDYVEASVTSPIVATGGVFGPFNNVITRGATIVYNGSLLFGSSTPGQASFLQTQTKTGTYVQSGTTTVTITITAHGYTVGRQVALDYTSGTAVDGEFTVTSVPTADTFTVTATGSLTTSGNVSATGFLDFQANNCRFMYTNLRPIGTAIKATVNGGKLLAFNDTANGFFDCRLAAGSVQANIANLVGDLASTSCRLILWTGAGGTLRISYSGLTVNGGAIEINSSIGAAGYVIGSANATVGTNYTVPAAGARVAYSGELRL